MPEQFLHGVEVIQIDDGPRPIRTVRSAVIGVVGTAPDSQAEIKATLQTGLVSADNALIFTGVLSGALGNQITVALVNPSAASSPLSVSVLGRDVTISLATDAGGVVTSLASEVATAVAASVDASALVTVANANGSDGSGVVTPARRAMLSGGVDEAFPLNTPVLVAGDAGQAAMLGASGTLPVAMNGIFDQTGAVVIVVRVEEGANEDATISNVIGGVNAGTGEYTGIFALLGAESVTGYAPRILCAPYFTHQRPTNLANPVVAELVGIAERLRAVVIADCPNTNDADAITYRGDWGSKRVYGVDPWVKVRNSLGEIVNEPASARVAGLIAKTDAERGFWWSPSNQVINGILGTSRDVDFTLGDVNSRANLLNEQEVATIVRQDGFRLWGNRGFSDDPKWSFLSVVRTADLINDSILRAHLWAVDRNITKTYMDDVTTGVNNYLDNLKAQGAILGGECYPAPGLNTPANIADGKVFFEFRFTPPYPAEHITFRSKLVNDYISEVL